MESINAFIVLLILAFSCYTKCNITGPMAVHMANLVLTLGFYFSIEEPLHTVIALFRAGRVLLILCLEDSLRHTIQRIASSLGRLVKALSGVMLI
jgi:hypothetical protein